VRLTESSVASKKGASDPVGFSPEELGTECPREGRGFWPADATSHLDQDQRPFGA